MSFKRKNCVICDESDFVECFDIINTINIVEDCNIDFNENEIKKLIFKGCKNCGCVQLENLFDPNEIYAQASHYTSGSIWDEHNNKLVEFISNNIKNSNKIIEVGGGSGRLCNLLLKKITSINKYKILEIETDSIKVNEKVEYIKGYCENFDFDKENINTIVMSHVFEHLYKPTEFLKNIWNSNVDEVFIAIPDMENLTKQNDYNNLSIQHTFYVDTRYIAYLFNKYNFKLSGYYNFSKNSNFYYFKRTNKREDLLFKNVNLTKELNLFYDAFKKKFQDLIINEPFYICPSGYYGKIVHYYLNIRSKSNILGFLDSDSHKINKRLSGTNCNIFNKDIIKSKGNIKVLIIAEKYKIEIMEELKSFNKEVIII